MSFTAVKCAKAPHQMFGGNGCVCGILYWVGHARSAASFQFDVRGHAREDVAGGVVDANLHAKYLVDALVAGLHIARKEFGLLIDLLDHAVEYRVWESIHADFRFLTEADVADYGFGNVDADVDLIASPGAWPPEYSGQSNHQGAHRGLQR